MPDEAFDDLDRQTQRAVAGLIRLALSAETRRSSLKRDEIAKKCSRPPAMSIDSMITAANLKLTEVFGYQIVELPPKESYKLDSLPAKRGTRAYVVVDVHDKPDNTNHLKAYERFENTHLIGILHTILAVVLASGGIISDTHLYSHLKKLGLNQSQCLPNEDKLTLESFINSLSRQSYLEKKKSSIGNHDMEFSWGARALVEIGENNIAQFMIHIINISRRDSSNDATQEINDKMLEDLQRGIGHSWNS
ncbi:hypothetical protein E3P77_02479 [Wallemia ichthyophaga]|nr:hypothetical protein E3P77_02479 [Wallemia ichthyophaga]